MVEDDQISVELYKRLFAKEGYDISSASSSSEAFEKIIELQPDCVLCDLLLPGFDGIDLFKKIRAIKEIKQPTFIVITGKTFDFDRRHAYQIGVDGYFTKPIDQKTFIHDILEIVEGTLEVEFWGVRGSFPVAAKRASRYGGNTNCVTVNIQKKHLFIFDAGTGIKELSNHLIANKKLPINAKLFLSHPHYDHINGLPFFTPLYIKSNELEIFGANQIDMDLDDVIANQMDNVYFPITIKEFAATISFNAISEEIFNVDDVQVKTILLNHPGRCLGFRLNYKNKSFCYVTDHELYLENAPNYNQFEVDRLLNFIHGTDILIIDSTYSDEDYKTKVGWGHSSISRVVDVADKAKVKLLCLHHHNPDETDKDIAAKLRTAKMILRERRSKTKCIAPKEGDKIII